MNNVILRERRTFKLAHLSDLGRFFTPIRMTVIGSRKHMITKHMFHKPSTWLTSLGVAALCVPCLLGPLLLALGLGSIVALSWSIIGGGIVVIALIIMVVWLLISKTCKDCQQCQMASRDTSRGNMQHGKV